MAVQCARVSWHKLADTCDLQAIHRKRVLLHTWVSSCYSQKVRGVKAKEPLAVDCCGWNLEVVSWLCCTVLPRLFVSRVNHGRESAGRNHGLSCC